MEAELEQRFAEGMLLTFPQPFSSQEEKSGRLLLLRQPIPRPICLSAGNVRGNLYQHTEYLRAFPFVADKLITEIKGLSDEMKVKGPGVTSNIQSVILLLSAAVV